MYMISMKIKEKPQNNQFIRTTKKLIETIFRKIKMNIIIIYIKIIILSNIKIILNSLTTNISQIKCFTYKQIIFITVIIQK